MDVAMVADDPVIKPVIIGIFSSDAL